MLVPFELIYGHHISLAFLFLISFYIHSLSKIYWGYIFMKMFKIFCNNDWLNLVKSVIFIKSVK